MFSRRASWDLRPNRIAALVESRRRAGLRILDLTESNPTRCGFDYPAEAILRALADPGGLDYDPEPLGSLSAREALSADYRARGARVPADRIVLTASTSEAYAHLFRILADPGDRVLVPVPSYPLFDLLARLSDVSLVPYPLCVDLDFSVDLDAVARGADAGARAVLVVSPGNPTGSFLERSEASALAAICAERGMALICDEVFGDYGFGSDPGRSGTLAGDSPALTFVLGGLSKALALPQLKLAWIAVGGQDRDVAEAVGRLEIVADTFLSVGTPVQRALPALLPLREGIQRQVMGRIEANRYEIERAAAGHPSCGVLPPEGGWSIVARVPRTRGDEEWAIRLLEADGLLVHPGYFFNFPADGYLVVSLLPPPEVFREGVGRLFDRVSREA